MLFITLRSDNLIVDKSRIVTTIERLPAMHNDCKQFELFITLIRMLFLFLFNFLLLLKHLLCATSRDNTTGSGSNSTSTAWRLEHRLLMNRNRRAEWRRRIRNTFKIKRVNEARTIAELLSVKFAIMRRRVAIGEQVKYEHGRHVCVLGVHFSLLFARTYITCIFGRVVQVRFVYQTLAYPAVLATAAARCVYFIFTL